MSGLIVSIACSLKSEDPNNSGQDSPRGVEKVCTALRGALPPARSVIENVLEFKQIKRFDDWMKVLNYFNPPNEIKKIDEDILLSLLKDIIFGEKKILSMILSFLKF